MSISKQSWSLHQPPFSSPFYPRFKCTNLCISDLYSIGWSILEPSSLFLKPEKFERDKYSKLHKLKTSWTSVARASRAWVEEKKIFFTFNFFRLGHLLAKFIKVQSSKLLMMGFILSKVSSSRRSDLFLEAKKSNKQFATSDSQFSSLISSKLIAFFSWSSSIYWEICLLKLHSENAYFITPARIIAPLIFIAACKVRSVPSVKFNGKSWYQVPSIAILNALIVKSYLAIPFLPLIENYKSSRFSSFFPLYIMQYLGF